MNWYFLTASVLALGQLACVDCLWVGYGSPSGMAC